MRWHISTAFLAVLAATASSAFDPAKDTDCPDIGICLSSFVFCGGHDCFFPEGVDQYMPGTDTPYAVLYHHRTYYIRWRQALPAFPVLIEWLFKPDPFGEPSDGDIPVMWSTNVTTNNSALGNFTFDPRAILKTFPTTAAPNVSAALAIASSAGDIGNLIRISQPGSGYGSLYSSQFTVQSSFAGQHSKYAQQHEAEVREQAEQKWRLGVGIGVGLGIPLVAAVAWLVGKKQGAGMKVKRVDSLSK